MKFRIIFIISAALTVAAAAHAKENTIIKLDDGSRLSVEICSGNTVHIKISPNGTFSESLLERYGILKTDWDDFKVVKTVKNGAVKFEFDDKVLTVNRKNGDISISDATSGEPVMGMIHFSEPGSKLCNKLSTVINDTFAGLHVASNGGIIGDDNGSLSEKDKTESGDPANACVLSIKMNDGERFYGGGSTSRSHIQHRGELLRMHTTYQHTEAPMPFMMSNCGWGVFNNTTRKNYFDVGSTDHSSFNIYNTAEDIDFYLFFGDGMPSILNAYTNLTGRTYVLPKWAYGLCFGPNMREDQWDILSDAFNFRQVGVPCDVFWLEPQWMEKRYDFSTEKKFNSKLFSVEPYWLEDSPGKKLYNRLFIGKLRSMGYHLGLWLCEEYDLSIAEEDAIAEREGRETSGQEHWMDHLTKFLDLGVEGFKLDPARTIDEHTFRTYYNGKTDREMHNLGQVLLPKQMAQMTRLHTGKRSWHHYCAAWSGTQHWGAMTSGDNGGGKTALYDQLNLGMSGYMNTSCDVMSVDRELEMQSLHFGAFLPWMQINSWFSMMHPFYYNAEEQTLYRNAIQLRYALMPYLYSCALEGAQTGMPIVRAMPLVFPDDRNCDDMCYQYMFGPSLCVGIFTDEIYLPAGEWYDAWTLERIESKGETFKRTYPDDRAGLLFIKGGSIIASRKPEQYIGTKPWSDLILKIFPHGESCCTMLEDDGDSYEFENGAIAESRFECSEKADGIEVRILPVVGEFEGMPEKRGYSLEIHAGRPSEVTVNGTQTKSWTFSDDGNVHIDLPGCSVHAEYVINLK